MCNIDLDQISMTLKHCSSTRNFYSSNATRTAKLSSFPRTFHRSNEELSILWRTTCNSGICLEAMEINVKFMYSVRQKAKISVRPFLRSLSWEVTRAAF